MIISAAQAQKLAAILPTLLPAEKIELLDMLEELEKRRNREKSRNSLLSFILFIEPTYKIGLHHRRLADLLEKIERGEETRIAVNIPPRFGKSHLISYYYPAWFLGKNANKKIIMASHTADLAVDFGRKVRNLIDTPAFKEVFPDVALSADSKSAGRWHTNKGGEYFAIGVGGALAGRGADLMLIDDPHSEQDLLNGNIDTFAKAYEWFAAGARPRLMPGGRIAIVQTRWAVNDLTGQLIKDSTVNKGSDKYKVVEFPAVLETQEQQPDNSFKTVQKSLWPEQWSLDALLQTKASMPSFQWSAQYQQDPTAEEGAIVKREWWTRWEEEEPPGCEFVLQSWDTAFEKTTRADFSACTTWGVFYANGDESWMQKKKREPRQAPLPPGLWKRETEKPAIPNIILLDAFKDRMEFPELKEMAFKHYDAWKPDSIIIEKKASGAPLIYEMRARGVPVGEYTPGKGQDKVARLNSVADIFASGMVWAPATRWAEAVMDEVAAFPHGANDDYVDSCLKKETMILMSDKTTKQICDIQAGEYVHTPLGPRRVLAAGCTGVKQVKRISGEGFMLEGTGNHPIRCGDEWIPLDLLRPGDILETVSTQEQSFKLKTLNARCFVRGHASINSIDAVSGLHPVYNLTVEDAECYYANSVLVHNCTLALMRFRMGGFIRLDNDVPDEPTYFKSRRNAAYY